MAEAKKERWVAALNTVSEMIQEIKPAMGYIDSTDILVVDDSPLDYSQAVLWIAAEKITDTMSEAIEGVDPENLRDDEVMLQDDEVLPQVEVPVSNARTWTVAKKSVLQIAEEPHANASETSPHGQVKIRRQSLRYLTMLGATDKIPIDAPALPRGNEPRRSVFLQLRHYKSSH